MMDEYRIWLFPHTGRTHQLRVHCAHQLGLNNPIKGDALYGMKDERLFLHAESIQFIHPSTNEMVYFEAKAPF
jgi:tRNA pseudouridine32 synthase/23S rRNA pseudouridine746 synthase